MGRRLEILGEISIEKKQVLIIDDYGHHPREIASTLEAIRGAWPHRRLIMVYQPHRYTRTRDLFKEFTEILSSVDGLLLLEIYSGGETPIEGISSSTLCEAIQKEGNITPVFVEHISHLTAAIEGMINEGDLLLLQGAGDISTVAPHLIATYQTA